MSPVHIDEVDPITRQRALEQIGETDGGTNALAILEDNNHSSTYSPAEMRARSIISRMASLCDKLKTLEDDIRALWLDFDNLPAGQTILGCATKKEFCEQKLHRTPQAIRYMLNPELRESKHCLPPAPEPPPVSKREVARQEYKKAHPESSTDSNHEIDEKIRKQFQQRSEATPETHWISSANPCPTGKRGFASIEELYAARKAEGKPQPVAYIGCCGQCRQVHLDKDQRTDTGVHLTFYIPPEIQDDAGLFLQRAGTNKPTVQPSEPIDPNEVLAKLFMRVDRLLPQLDSAFCESCDSSERQFPQLIEDAIAAAATSSSVTIAYRTFANVYKNENLTDGKITHTYRIETLAEVLDKAAGYLANAAARIRAATK